MRLKATIEYNGKLFAGFQRQKHTPQTIATAIERALNHLNIDTEIRGSGRTDAGVHASNQVIDFEVPPYWSNLSQLKRSLNRQLCGIRFKHIIQVDNDFHARFHAKERIYRYIFKTTTPSVFEQEFVAYYKSFDRDKLQEALALLEGEHDFSLLCKSGSVTHTNIRRIFKASYCKRHNYHFIYFRANGFLRAQVRMMIDLAMIYAQGKITRNELIGQIENRTKISSHLAPPQGLYLARILY